MADPKTQITKEDAQAALESIQVTEESAVIKSVMPQWFIAFTGIIIFIVFVGIKPEGSPGVFPVIVLSLTHLWMMRKQGLIRLLTKQQEWRFVRGLMLIALFYLLVVYLYRIQQVSLAPLIGGTIAASIYAFRAETKRKETISGQSQTDSLS